MTAVTEVSTQNVGELTRHCTICGSCDIFFRRHGSGLSVAGQVQGKNSDGCKEESDEACSRQDGDEAVYGEEAGEKEVVATVRFRTIAVR